MPSDALRVRASTRPLRQRPRQRVAPSSHGRQIPQVALLQRFDALFDALFDAPHMSTGGLSSWPSAGLLIEQQPSSYY